MDGGCEAFALMELERLAIQRDFQHLAARDEFEAVEGARIVRGRYGGVGNGVDGVQTLDTDAAGGMELDPVAGTGAAKDAITGGGGAAAEVGASLEDVAGGRKRDKEFNGEAEVLTEIGATQVLDGAILTLGGKLNARIVVTIVLEVAIAQGEARQRTGIPREDGAEEVLAVRSGDVAESGGAAVQRGYLGGPQGAPPDADIVERAMEAAAGLIEVTGDGPRRGGRPGKPRRYPRIEPG